MSENTDPIERYYALRQGVFGFPERIELIQNVACAEWKGLQLTTDELKRGMNAITKELPAHDDKIANPEKNISGLKQHHLTHQAALLGRKWRSDIAREQEQLEIFECLLKQLGGG